jgi:hypothetical protein
MLLHSYTLYNNKNNFLFEKMSLHLHKKNDFKNPPPDFQNLL